MKVLDTLSMCTCNRFKQSLPVASCPHFQVYFWHQVLVLKSYEKYKISLSTSKDLQGAGVHNFVSFFLSSHYL